MTTEFRTLAGLMLLAGMLGLAACDSSDNKEALSASPTAAAVTPAPATVQPEGSASPDQAAPTAAVASPSAAATEAAGAATANPATPQDSSKQLKELLQLAEQGKVPGVEYAAHNSMIDDVKAAWGEPDTEEPAGKGMYAVYNDKHVVVGYNKGSKIFDVRSSAAELQKLTLKEIEKVLGKPNRTTVNGSDKIYIYQAGKRYDLKFIIPESSGTVDHISVFSEMDSINNMAG